MKRKRELRLLFFFFLLTLICVTTRFYNPRMYVTYVCVCVYV